MCRHRKDLEESTCIKEDDVCTEFWYREKKTPRALLREGICPWVSWCFYRAIKAGQWANWARRGEGCHRKELLDWKLGFCCQTPAEKELELNAKINLHQEASQKKPELIISTCVSGNTQSLSPPLQGPINSLNKTAWLSLSSKRTQFCETSIEEVLLSLYMFIVT